MQKRKEIQQLQFQSISKREILEDSFILRDNQ